MENNTQKTQADRLIFFGLLLFLVGLLIGLVVHQMKNPRMGLSAHLEGIMNGMFLMILGLIWTRLLLSKSQLKITYWLVIYGTFTNILAVFIAAVTGFGKMMPIAGGREGTGIAESLISFLLISLSLCMLIVCVFVLLGFFKNIRSNSNE